ncbi:MAG TPA: arginase family protein [Acidimicrobiales bacterium]|nr:arginase family protein [Acidimicrobiales bacterium]
MATTRDSNWLPASSLITDEASSDRVNVALFGVSTWATSLSARSSLSTPSAVREALAYYSTWSYSDTVDLADAVALVDHGDVADPDGPDADARVRALTDALDDRYALRIALGGDNAATWRVLNALGADTLDDWGLVTLDAHLDLRDGVSNGSPVRQLLEAGLSGAHVVQVGLADFSNSPEYARRASAAGITVIARDELRREPVESAARRALELAGADGRRVYVDIDMDVADRSVVPGCPAAAPGGLSADEVRRFVRAAAADQRVAALDVTEIDVERDRDQRTVRLAALLVLEALAGVRRRTS